MTTSHFDNLISKSKQHVDILRELEGGRCLADTLGLLVACLERHREAGTMIDYVNRSRGYPTAKEWGEIVDRFKETKAACERLATPEKKK